MLNAVASYLNLRRLIHNIRFYVLLINFTIAMVVFSYFIVTIPDETARAIQFTQWYAFLAVANLYLAVLATPLTKLFDLPFAQAYLKARRAIGVSAFLYACMHVRSAFFDELGGFNGLGFLDSKYLIAISLSSIALLILFVMASTSFDYWVARLRFKKWKRIHRFVYLAVLLITIHALMLGSHFSNLSGVIPQIYFGALIILLGLESLRFDNYLSKKWSFLPKFGLSFVLILAVVIGGAVLLYAPTGGSGSNSPFNIHAAHLQLAEQAQQGQRFIPANSTLANNPALIGDLTKRYTVSFFHPDQIEPSQDTNLSFQIYDASSGNSVDLFQFVYTKTMHLVVVDNELNFFNHIHPTQGGSTFNVTTQFPHPGRYHLYVNFQPLGAIEQQFAFSVDVGNMNIPTVASQSSDTNLTKTFGNYQVSLSTKGPLVATDMSIGKETLAFNIKDASGQPVTTLKPYLAAFGHLVLINEQTYDYIHVHPSNIFPLAADANGGPEVDFLPLGLYGPIKPGIYRVFAQFNPDNHLFTADFTIRII